MNPIAAAALASWRFEPLVLAGLVATAVIYFRGWRRLRASAPARLPVGRLLCFFGGLLSIAVAICSPLDPFAGLLLQVHMVQHLLLTMVAPPLLWLGWPEIPLLRGLPRGVAVEAGRLRRAPLIAPALGFLFHPAVAWMAMTLATWLWHVPTLYELALRSPSWHQVEHATLLGTAVLFWRAVVRPWPSRARWSRWALIPYLVLADVQNTALAAILCFSHRVLYPTYAAAPRLWGSTALGDQIAAGAFMWVAGSIAYLVPLGAVVVDLLAPKRLSDVGTRARRSLALPPRDRPSSRRPRSRRRPVFSLRRLAALRPALQGLALIFAVVVVVDGLFGPRLAPTNLAGVLPWTYWRGMAIVGLLAAGNVFCMACPLTLARDQARRWLPARWSWPRWLRTKWLAVALFAAYLWSYEAFDLWDDPRATAIIVLGYFATAIAIDGLFRGASFCKYVCPIGQYHFVLATASPLEVTAREAQICRACTTHDCVRGNTATRGCELELFLPEKVGNLDCTFCLDCVRSCPHDNVKIGAGLPGRSLLGDPRRSSLGRLSLRPDIAALSIAVVFGAFVNAAGMVAPIAARIGAASSLLGGERFASTIFFLVGMTLIPALLVGVCSWLSQRGSRADLSRIACRFSGTLIPLGLAMWAAHLLFHLATAAWTAIPAFERAGEDFGFATATPVWSMGSWTFPLGWLQPMQVVLLDGGLLLSLYLAWRVAGEVRASRSLSVFAPWGVLAYVLWMAGVWLLLQPMEMRGMLH